MILKNQEMRQDENASITNAYNKTRTTNNAQCTHPNPLGLSPAFHGRPSNAYKQQAEH